MLTTEQRISLRDELLEDFRKIEYKDTYPMKVLGRIVRDLDDNSEIKKKFDLYVSQFRSEREARFCLSHLDDMSNHICPICGKVNDFYLDADHNRYSSTCGSKECKSINTSKIAKSEDTKKKYRKSMIEKYGVEHPSHSKEIREKTKQTNLKIYGTEHPAQSKHVQEKIEATNMSIYGVKHLLQSESIKEKIKQANLEKYGVEYDFQAESVKEKIKETLMNKYGVEHPTQCKDIMDKVKQTNKDRYGVEYVMQNDELKERFRKSRIKNYSFNDPFEKEDITNIITEIKNSNPDIDIDDIYANDNLFTSLVQTMHTKKNRLLRLNEISEIFNISAQTVKERAKKLNILDLIFIKDSDLEVKFKEFLDENNIKYDRHNRILYNEETKGIGEIDFLLKEYNIGIEVNDIQTHNIKSKEYNYHLNKTIKCSSMGIRLIHLWEWELTNKELWDKTSKWIINICNNNKTKLFARNCELKKLSSTNEEKEFLNNYHLQGYIKSEVCYGLYYNNELIQVMSFCKPRYNSNYEWELLRLCTKYSYSVIGGSNRLLKNFIRSHNPNSIISYCDLSKFTGKVYTNMGFAVSNKIQPQIMWYNDETEKRFSQTSLNMLGADKLIGTNYGKGTSNEEIAIQSGYKKVYNCGLEVYTLNLQKKE